MESQDNLQGEHYNLRWNNYTTNLIQVFSEHQHHETLVDVTLTCEGQFVKAHKLILSACSGFFQEMFNIHNIQHPIIVLNGIKFNHLQHIIQFIYHGEVKIVDDDLEGVLALGETFQVKGLSSVKLKQQMSVSDGNPISRPCEAPPNPIQASTPRTPTYQQQKDRNTSNTANNQDKSRAQPCKGVRKALVINNITNSDNNRNEQSRSSTLNNKDQVEPPIKRTKTPEGPIIGKNKTESTKNDKKENLQESERIPRPTNAFMIFANEWRKKLAVEHPDENNKEISVRLGNMWKSLSAETKESYYLAARKAQLQHELKYPGYIHPLDARKKKSNWQRGTDSLANLGFMDTLDYNEVDDAEDDDLQIIEVDEAPIDVYDSPSDNPPEK